MTTRKRSAAPTISATTTPSKVSKKNEDAPVVAASSASSVELVELDEAAQTKLQRLLNLDLSSSDFQTPAQFAARFQQIADVLLNEAILYICHVPWRLAEIEFYYQSAKHPDFFTHCDPLQKSNAQWYNHKTGNGYRSASFKGIDITFGNSEAFGGILVRAIQSVSGSEFVEGPCLCVEKVMDYTKTTTVPDLVALLQRNQLSIFPSLTDPKKRRDSVLYIGFPTTQPTKLSHTEAKFAAAAAGSAAITSFFSTSPKKDDTKGKEEEKGEEVAKKPTALVTIHTSPRVGLTLKRSSGGNHKNPISGSKKGGNGKEEEEEEAEVVSTAQEDWLMLPYRFMSQVGKMRKGKHYIIVALHQQYGLTQDQIVTVSKSTRPMVQKFLQLFEQGKSLPIKKFAEQKLTPEDVCQLWGAIVASQEKKNKK